MAIPVELDWRREELTVEQDWLAVYRMQHQGGLFHALVLKKLFWETIYATFPIWIEQDFKFEDVRGSTY